MEKPTARRLIVMRHAKSDWSGGGDFERPLNARGRRDAPAMARWLADQNLVPRFVLCSAAARTTETVRRMLENWDLPPTVNYSRSLYLAGPSQIADVICEHASVDDSVLVMAHNPGLSQFASTLAGESVSMPTAGAWVFEVAIDHWNQFRSDTPTRVIASMRPKALTGEGGVSDAGGLAGQDRVAGNDDSA